MLVTLKGGQILSLILQIACRLRLTGIDGMVTVIGQRQIDANGDADIILADMMTEEEFCAARID